MVIEKTFGHRIFMWKVVFLTAVGLISTIVDMYDSRHRQMLHHSVDIRSTCIAKFHLRPFLYDVVCTSVMCYMVD
jgi:hypothetical protein